MTKWTVLTGFALLSLAGSPVSADIVSLTDGTASWQQLSGSVDLSAGATEGDNTTYIFQEQTDLTLGSDLAVDIAGDGSFTGSGDPGDETISAGTRVESYIVHFDPSGSDTNFVTQDGMSVTFETPILGIIGKSADLENTDGILGESGSTYEPVEFRGTWDNSDVRTFEDTATVSGNTLSLGWESRADFAEQFRVVTLAPAAVPEPSSMILLGLTGLFGAGIGWRRRRRNNTEAESAA